MACGTQFSDNPSVVIGHVGVSYGSLPVPVVIGPVVRLVLGPEVTSHKKSELSPHQMARKCEVPGSLRTKSELRPHQMARKSEVPVSPRTKSTSRPYGFLDFSIWDPRVFSLYSLGKAVFVSTPSPHHIIPPISRLPAIFLFIAVDVLSWLHCIAVPTL